MEYEILPGILEQEKTAIAQKLERIKPFTQTVHIDLLDGVFAPNTTFSDPSFFSAYKDEFFFELHMMVDNPVQYVKPWAEAGIKRFIGHVEKMPDQYAFVDEVSEYGEAGLAFDAKTPLEKLAVPIYDLDVLLLMTINAGFSGQPFLEETLEKIRVLRSQAEIVIEVDGGINDQTIVKAKDAGANRFVATSFLFGNDSPAKQYQRLTDLCQSRLSSS